jgi:hypothetical protein
VKKHIREILMRVLILCAGVFWMFSGGFAGAETEEHGKTPSMEVRLATPRPAFSGLAQAHKFIQVVGKVEKISAIPAVEQMDYPDLLSTILLSVENVEAGEYENKDLLVMLFVIRDKRNLGPAFIKAGDRLRLCLLSWDNVIPQIKSVQQVDDILNFNLPPYLAVAVENLTEPPVDIAEALPAREYEIKCNLDRFKEELNLYGQGSYEIWAQGFVSFLADIEKQAEPLKNLNAFTPYRKSGVSIYNGLIGEITGVPPDSNIGIKEIIRFNTQLKRRGIHLIYVSIPRPILIWPELYSDVPIPHSMVSPVYRQLLQYLTAHDVEVVDMLPLLLKARGNEAVSFFKRNTIDQHPTPAAMGYIADLVAERLRRYGFDRRTYEVFISRDCESEPGGSCRNEKQTVWPDGQLYTDAVQSPILIIGDSTIRIDVPVKSSGFSSLLALRTGIRPSLIQANRFSLTSLAKENPAVLEGTQVVIWVQWSLFICDPNQPGFWNVIEDWDNTRVFK